MHRVFFAFVVTASTAIGIASIEADDPKPHIEDLAWMGGHWVGKTAEGEMEELWIEPKGGMMLAVHRETADDRPTFFEYLRIEDRDGSVVYVASPRGGHPTEFELSSIDGTRAVFENPDHDFPQRIIYHLQDGVMTSRIEGTVDGKFRSAEWAWSLVR